MQQSVIILLVIFTLFCCENKNDSTLPILGERKVNKTTIGGKEHIDTVYHTVGSFLFLNQFNDTIKSNVLENKVFISTCFFSTCPTICHKLMEETLDSVNSVLGDKKDFYILSHTINPSYDTPDILKEYSKKFDIKGKNWYFLTGLKEDSLYNFLLEKYFLTASQDKRSENSGGYVHSASIVLIDKKNRIRGIYDGMDKEKISVIIQDANYLLNDDNYK